MARNQKLTSVIAGRIVAAVDVQGSLVAVHFADGSVMTVHTDGSPPSGAPVGRVRAVRQQGTQLIIDLDGGSTMEMQTAESTSSVMVRDKAQGFEYSD
jgi:hypothetical protein